VKLDDKEEWEAALERFGITDGLGEVWSRKAIGEEVAGKF